MANMAQWGPQKFSCSPSRLAPFRDFKATMAVKSDTQTDADGTNKTATKGLEPETVSLAVDYLLSAGVNPWKEVDGWRNELGNSYALYIGGKKYGNERFTLKSVEVSNLLSNNSGRVLGVTVTVALTEYSSTVTKAKTKSKAKKSSKAKTKKSLNNKAMNATVNKQLKAAAKPSLLSRKVMVK